MQSQRIRFLTLLVCGLSIAAPGVDMFSLEGRTPAPGVFEYELYVPLNLLWSEMTVSHLSISSEVRVVEQEAIPDEWTNVDRDNEPGALYLEWTLEPWDSGMERPYRALFRSQTEWTSWKRGGATVLFEMWVNLDHPFWQYYEWCPPGRVCYPQFVGYANLDMIVPCPVEEADGSLPNHYSALESPLKDPIIQRILLDDRAVLGFDYQIDFDSVVQVESSFDLDVWHPVAEFLAVEGDQQWLSPEPLIDIGNFYRLNVVANGHPPEPVVAGMDSATSERTGVPSFVPVKVVGVNDGLLELEVQTKEGGSYQLMVGKTPAALEAHILFEAVSSRTTLQVESSVLDTEGFLAVTERLPADR